ncbi:exostosin-like 2 [Halichondria panicea]|uniref:exostosin-like 2 n=1 Tax=Halichondria panicea TaxID=6063 RepID=UPI00312B8800
MLDVMKKLLVAVVVLGVMIMLLASWTLYSDGSNHIARGLTDHISKLYHSASDVGYWPTTHIHGGGVTCNVCVPPPNISVSSAPSLNKKNISSRIVSTALERWQKQVFSTDMDLNTENFTIVMLTYRRESILPKILLHYCETPRLAKIVVIWNDVERVIPQAILNLSNMCRIPLEFIREKENKITNRFKPRPQIKTDCVFILDDDRWINDLSDLTFAFNVWQENRHRIVGFENCMRSHSLNSQGQYTYDQAVPGRGVSIMMTATGLLHRAYLDMYFDPGALLPGGMMKDKDWTMYCDDILMNCVVGRFLELVSWPQPSLVVVKGKGGLKNLERESAKAGGHPGLHVIQPDHYKRRSVCLNKLAGIFGHLPLKLTKIIVKENVKT